MAESTPAAAAAGDISLKVKWSGKTASFSLPANATIVDLKQALCDEWGVLVHRQKIMGLKVRGHPAGDLDVLSDMKIKPTTTVMMMGSREEDIQGVLAEPEESEVVDDLEWTAEAVADADREENLAKIQRRIDTYEIKIFNEPRPGKKLLVLDIDYTLYDHRSGAENFAQLMRPYLHEFLTAAYEHYDIVIWSATGMSWIEVKMRELGVADNPNYKIAFYLDVRAMITLYSKKYGVTQAKPLGVIWGKFPEFYHPRNTIMFDDVRHNFLMNPKNGLRIRPCRHLPLDRSDEELLHLRDYLLAIAPLSDAEFEELNHRKWEEYIQRRR
eukprot:m.51202 g.51202  ORF g.51202 m.51202 type:complete len:327 (-) comp6594_c0_seq2:24-1004(-)